MDIAALSTNLSQAALATQVGVSLAVMSKDLMAQQGQALAQMLSTTTPQNDAVERSITPHLGGTIDVKL